MPRSLQADQRPRLVEQSQHDLLAVHGADDRGAHVDRPLIDDDRELAVLAAAPLDDVELGHHLDATRDRGAHAAREGDRLAQRSVDAVPNPDVVLLRLDVDVGRTAADALREDAVHDLDDRGVLVDREGVGSSASWSSASVSSNAWM